MTIAWKIEWLNASTQTINGFSEVVLNAGWRVTATDGDYSASAYASVSFPEPAEGGSYTPFADLTEEQVLGWVWENGVDKDAAEASVTAQLETQKNPPVIQPPLPWSV